MCELKSHVIKKSESFKFLNFYTICSGNFIKLARGSLNGISDGLKD